MTLTSSKQFPTPPKLMNLSSVHQNEDEVTNTNKIRVKIVFKGNILITYIDRTISFDNIVKKVREFLRVFPFTIKWLDDEGDPCTISSQMELDTAIRYYLVMGQVVKVPKIRVKIGLKVEHAS